MCGTCGAKYDPKTDEFANETLEQEVSREVREKMLKIREAQRIVNTKTTVCTKTNCAWFSKGSENNCYRDPGDCRFSQL